MANSLVDQDKPDIWEERETLAKNVGGGDPTVRC